MKVTAASPGHLLRFAVGSLPAHRRIAAAVAALVAVAFTPTPRPSQLQLLPVRVSDGRRPGR